MSIARTAWRVNRAARTVKAAKRGRLVRHVVRRRATRAAFRLFR